MKQTFFIMNYQYRNRIIYCIVLLVTFGLGLLSRADFWKPPEFVILYVGDALWALLVYWLVCILKPEYTAKSQLIITVLFSLVIECSQFYQAEWINQLRQTTLGGLILGYGFKVTDLIAYAVGAGLGAFINNRIIRKSHDEDL